MPKCDFCKQEKPLKASGRLIHARREFKTYAGESKYTYFSVCGNCLGRLDLVEYGLEVLDDDGQPLELERAAWHEEQPRPEIAAAVKGRQMTIDETLQLKLF
jgi:hypothetical protein